jgi:L-ascorbate metabolism protein UlaG (beta-lactamase superfamily)
MFEIEYKGANTVVISSKKAKLITDPKLSVAGLKDMSVKNAIELSTEKRFALNSGDALLYIEGPGEYEVADFAIRGVAAQRHLDEAGNIKAGTVYRIEVGGVRIALLGNIDVNLDEEQLESIGVVDMVILPVGGGGYTLDATSAAQLMRKLDAKIALPIHYAGTAPSYEVPQDSLDVFVKEFGGEVEKIAKYKVKSPSALPQVPTVIELTRS